MSVHDLLNVEFDIDNLKVFDQTWRAILLAFGTDMDESFLGLLKRRTVQEVFTWAGRVIVVPE